MEDNETQTAGKPAGIRPMNDRVLVRQAEFKDQLESGLYIPQGNREGYKDVGVVEAVGPKVTVDVKPGDRVMFKRRAGSALIPDTREGGGRTEKDLLLLKEEDLLAVIED